MPLEKRSGMKKSISPTEKNPKKNEKNSFAK